MKTGPLSFRNIFLVHLTKYLTETSPRTLCVASRASRSARLIRHALQLSRCRMMSCPPRIEYSPEHLVLAQSVRMGGLEILKGTHYPRTDCPGGGGGGALGPRARCPWGTIYPRRNVRGTAFPRTECPADNLQGDKTSCHTGSIKGQTSRRLC